MTESDWRFEHKGVRVSTGSGHVPTRSIGGSIESANEQEFCVTINGTPRYVPTLTEILQQAASEHRWEAYGPSFKQKAIELIDAGIIR